MTLLRSLPAKPPATLRVAALCAASTILIAGVSPAAAQGLDEAVGEGLREQSCRGLAASTVGVPDPIRVGKPAVGIPATWAPGPANLLPRRVDFRTEKETFNRLYEFATRAGRLYARSRSSRETWRVVPLPACVAGRIASISVDDDELIALDSARRIFTMDNALKDGHLFNWTSRWGTPFWLGLGYTLPRDIKAWAWSVISPTEDATWTDPAGNRTDIGQGKVSHIWGLRSGGTRLTFWDPWLPPDESYEMCGPARGRFRAVNLSASGSRVFVIGQRGDMFTRLYDFDISGHDPVFFRYAYEDQRSKGDGSPIQLPAEPWRRQPKIPGKITDRISIEKTGSGAISGILRVEGSQGGLTGYWERDLAAARSRGWRFYPTGGRLAGERIANPPRDTSKRGLDRGEDARYVMHEGPGRAALENFNVYCSPARLTTRSDGRERRLRLHSVDGLRQQARGRGLDQVPRIQAGAIEGPRGEFEEVTVEATREEISIPERGWRFTRER